MTPEPLEKIAQSALALVKTESLGTGVWQADRLRLTVNTPGTVHFFWPSDTADDWSEADDERKERVLERWLLGVRRQPPARTPEFLRSRVMPRVRPLAQFTLWELRRQVVERSDPDEGSAAELSIPQLPLGGELGLHLGFELAQDVSDVSAGVLASWGESLEALMPAALDRLRARTQKGAFVEIQNGLFATAYEDGHDAARIALPELTEGLQLRGEPIFLAPRPGTLLIAGSEDDGALLQMGRLGLELTNHPLAVSGTAFRRTAKGLEAWLPEATRSSYHALRIARIPVQVGLYNLQKNLLEATAELERREEVVSPFVPLEHPQDGLTTASVWIRGTEPLIPKAEYVGFVTPRPGQEHAHAVTVPWDKAVALPGVTVERTSHLPERYRARGWPNAKDLAPFE